ncbi:MAG: hypothetical protein ACRDZ9_00530 [Acidimicrobiales bacterium]
MAGDRFVLLGVARPRAPWFGAVGQWAMSAALPAEFIRCVSVEELLVRLGGVRVHSAVLVDGSLPAVDRDVLEAARQAGCVVLVVDDQRLVRDWAALGAAAVLPPTFTREALVDALATHAPMVGRGEVRAPDEGTGGIDLSRWWGDVAAVCGAGGAGASTVAAALAQGLGEERRYTGGVVLADLALNGEQAMLHDVGDVVPGVQELVEAHRSGEPGPDEVRGLTFSIVERRYHLLLGLRRSRYWATLRPRSFEAGLASLRSSFGAVVCDITADFEGEAETGSAEVEDRNVMARTAAGAADVVLAVGRPGVKGVHALVRVLADLATLGVPAGRVVPVFNAAPRQPRARSELARALATLTSPVMDGGRTASPVFLPVRRVEEALRDAVRLPVPLPAATAGAFGAVLQRLGPSTAPGPCPYPVAPGSLGLGAEGQLPA